MCVLCSLLDYDSENLNSEDIYSSLRGVSEAIQSFSFRSQDDLMEPLRRDGLVRKPRPQIPKKNPSSPHLLFIKSLFLKSGPLRL